MTTTTELMSINPLIDADGNTYKVSSLLEFVAAVLDQGQGVRLDEGQCFGAAVLLSTCAAALRKMQEASE